MSPVALVVLTTAVSRVLVMETAMGLTSGHTETLTLVERLLERYGGIPAQVTSAPETADAARTDPA